MYIPVPTHPILWSFFLTRKYKDTTVVYWKKVGAQDVDMTGMLTYKKEWKIIADPYAFLNAIRLIVFLITEKLVKFYQMYFVSSKCDSENSNTIHFIR